jgi:hypothetical protein
MSVLDLLRKPATGTAALRDKAARLRGQDPLARRPSLEAERRAALMAGNDARVDEIDRELVAAERDAERRELAIAELERQIADAEQADLAAERAKKVKAAKSATRRMPDALAAYEKAADAVRASLAQIDEIEALVAEANAVLPADQQLPGAEFSFRGLPAEPRTERSKRTIGYQWHFVETGGVVPERLVDKITATGAATGELEIVDFRAAAAANQYALPEVADRDRDESFYPTRKVAVIKRRIVEIEYDEHRAAYIPDSLRAGVWLPSVLPEGGDPRAPRTTMTLRQIED